MAAAVAAVVVRGKGWPADKIFKSMALYTFYWGVEDHRQSYSQFGVHCHFLPLGRLAAEHALTLYPNTHITTITTCKASLQVSTRVLARDTYVRGINNLGRTPAAPVSSYSTDVCIHSNWFLIPSLDQY